MKTRAMKKVLSILCVLALLMSVCVVSLVGTTSAAETYTFNVNGQTYSEELTAGDTLAAPDAPYVFEGWYTSLDFTTKVETAGDVKTLYAKFTSTVLDFDGATSTDYFYAPNDGKIGSYTVVADPVNGGNKVLKFSIGSGRNNFGVPTYAGSNVGYTLVDGQKYELSFRYYVKSTGTTAFTGIGVSPMSCEAVGIGTNGGNKNDSYPGVQCPVTDGEWASTSLVFTASKITDINKYLVFTAYIGGSQGYAGEIYFDDIAVTPIVEAEYTFNNKGVVTTDTLTPGDDLPVVRGASFEGWYDSTLSVKYNKVPATNTKLFAKFNKNVYTFDKGMDEIYDPLGGYGDNGWVEFVKEDSNNVLKINGSTKRRGFAFAGAIGADSGLSINKGEVYTVSFKYKANVNASMIVYVAADAGVGVSGNKENSGLAASLTAATEWTEFEQEFMLAADSTLDLNVLKNLYFTVQNQNSDLTFYLDDVTIAKKLPEVSMDDVVMDFEEDANGDDFKWSVADANNYTVSSGNGYVNRGEIVEEADGNHIFRMKHFSARNANIYFTVNDGSKQFEMVNYGLYTIEFDYKVEHSETESKLGLVFVKPTTASSGLKYQTITVFDEFETREDTEWTHISYTFGAELTDYPEYTSVGLYLFNSTNVPETNVDTGVATATSVLFDNIVVKTHSASQEEGMIVFDSMGGTDCTPVIGTAAAPVGLLPQPTKYGYVFTGWKYDVEDKDGNLIPHDLTETTLMPDFVTEAYATWKLAPGVIELTFRTNVDEYDANAPVLVAYPGKPIAGFPTENPTTSGAQFLGWYYDRAFTKPVDKNVAPNESSTIFAKWSNAGTLIDFENMPVKGTDGTPGVYSTDRIKIKELEDGNKVAFYDFSIGSNQSNTSGIASIMLHTGTDYVPTVEGLDYTVTFKYKVLEAKAKGAIGSVISAKGNAWTSRAEQTGRMEYGEASDKWLEGSYSFTAVQAADAPADHNFLSLGVSNDCKIYIDDVVVTSSINEMNIYGSAVIFNTNGGEELAPISGDPGDKLVLPTPKKSGYKFVGWYTDKTLETPLTATVYGEERLMLYAKWQLGKFTEDFEEYPASLKTLGLGAYAIYTKTSPGFDASNVHGGETSIFRSAATAGVKNFTVMRSKDLALTKGETYTLTMYVKPTSIGDANAAISIVEMDSNTGINNGTVSGVIANIADLKEGEWNLVTYTFTAKSEYIGISTTAGNDMYFDDITVTLKGYTGASTGDASVSPIIVIALVILSAGALLITGKKVFSK